MIPYGSIVMRGGLALALYTSAVLAEIVRGGLNSIAEGQFEAAKSQGFTLIQTLTFIVLPQCFKRIIPSLLSQVITTIKDTSFLQVVAIPEYTRSGFVVMGRYTTTPEVFMIFSVLALGYFVVCFSLSCVVRSYQKELRQQANESKRDKDYISADIDKVMDLIRIHDFVFLFTATPTLF
jgi:putative glutamine transport system permease protein